MSFSQKNENKKKSIEEIVLKKSFENRSFS